MNTRLSLAFAALALASGAAYGQIITNITGYAVGYAANLNIGDSVVNISNSGVQGGFTGAFLAAKTEGNICVNVYTFDPAEEEIACCACLVTPNGLNALSVKNDLISNPLTPAIPTSVVIKLVSSEPGIDPTGAFTLCNPANVTFTGTAGVLVVPAVPYYPLGLPTPPFDPGAGRLVPAGMLAWGTTLEPSGTPGTYSATNVPFLGPTLNFGLGIPIPLAYEGSSELGALTSTCNFIQSDGSGFGICKSCQTGALAGTKK
jgi:hypothetical protein